MNKQFIVTYSLDHKPSDSHCAIGSTSTQNLSMTVTALHSGQARTIVESMFGGPTQCRVHTAQSV